MAATDPDRATGPTRVGTHRRSCRRAERIEAAFEDMTAGHGARSVVCFGIGHETST
jgi:hypothetical protein